MAEACQVKGVQVLVCQADVSKDEDCRRLAATTLEKFGRIDGLINNAGTTKFCAHDDLNALSSEDFQAIYAVNVIGPYQMIRAVSSTMKAQGERPGNRTIWRRRLSSFWKGRE